MPSPRELVLNHIQQTDYALRRFGAQDSFEVGESDGVFGNPLWPRCL